MIYFLCGSPFSTQYCLQSFIQASMASEPAEVSEVPHVTLRSAGYTALFLLVQTRQTIKIHQDVYRRPTPLSPWPTNPLRANERESRTLVL